MRSLSFFVAIALLAASACSQTASSTGGEAGVGDGGGEDTSPLNTCTAAGSVCKGNGVCGIGFSLDTSHLCAQSVEICCVPNVSDAQVTIDGATTDATPVDSGLHDAGTPDTGATDAGHDASSPDAGTAHDAGTVHDAGTAHDAGHDAGTPDAGHDGGVTLDAGGTHDAAADVKTD